MAMDDTTSITALEMAAMQLPEPTDASGNWLRGWVRSRKQSLQVHRKDKVAEELAKAVFQPRRTRQTWWSRLFKR